MEQKLFKHITPSTIKSTTTTAVKKNIKNNQEDKLTENLTNTATVIGTKTSIGARRESK